MRGVLLSLPMARAAAPGEATAPWARLRPAGVREVRELLRTDSLLGSCPETATCQAAAVAADQPPAECAAVGLLRCPEAEPALERAFSHWWGGEPLLATAVPEFCNRVGKNQVNAGRVAPLGVFAVILHAGKVYARACVPVSMSAPISQGGLERHADLRDALGFLQDLSTVFDFDVHILLGFGDEPIASKVLYANVPIFHPMGSDAFWSIPWPAPYHLRALMDGVLDNTTLGGTSWPDRIPKAWWRGSLIGPSTSLLSTALFQPRLRLMRLANSTPDLFDVAFTSIHATLGRIQWSTPAVQRILHDARARLLEFQDFWSHAPRFKFVLVVPGVTQSAQLTHVLRSGSVPLVVWDPTYEHLYPALEPWKHFVPIQNDLADLVPALELLRSDDELARHIAQAAGALAAERLRPEGAYCYAWRALRGLRRLTADQAEVIREALPRFEEVPRIDLGKYHAGFRPLRQRLEDARGRPGCGAPSGGAL